MGYTPKPIKIVRYNTLKECLLAYLNLNGEEYSDADLDKCYWEGYNGGRKYRQNIGRWLKSTKYKCWGWAVYHYKEIHIWAAADCSSAELIKTLAHEYAHLHKPRHEDKREEEKKANMAGDAAKFAYNLSIQIMDNTHG